MGKLADGVCGARRVGSGGGVGVAKKEVGEGIMTVIGAAGAGWVLKMEDGVQAVPKANTAKRKIAADFMTVFYLWNAKIKE